MPTLQPIVCAIAGVAIATLSLLAPAQAVTLNAEQRAMAQACRADARQLCASVERGEGRMLACLGAHKTRLAPACRAQVDKMESCPAEIKKRCPGVEETTELSQCARAKRDELSAHCRATIGG